jgi:DNA end-binding protein Ku
VPRAIWTGTISFGLVNIPVRLLPATRRRNVRFHEIDRVTGQRVHHERVRWPEPEETFPTWSRETLAGEEAEAEPAPAPAPTREVLREEIVKGYEVAPDTYVTVTQEEIEQLRPERTKTIDIEEFVDASEVDSVHFDAGYYVVPQREYERPFALLVEALARSGKLAISWIVLRQRRHLAALRPHQGILLLATMYFGDEVLPVEEAGARPTEAPSERELKMAELLVDTMTGSFDPTRYEDGYRKRLLDLIESRKGEAWEAPEPDERPATGGVEELMAALEASLRQVRERQAAEAPPQATRRRRAGGSA